MIVLIGMIGTASVGDIHAQVADTEALRTLDDKEAPYSPKVFYFHRNRSDLDYSYRNNKSAFESLMEELNSASLKQYVDTIQIVAGCSPLGPKQLNDALAARRAATLKKLIHENYRTVDGFCLPITICRADDLPIILKPIGVDSVRFKLLKQRNPEMGIEDRYQYTQYAAVIMHKKILCTDEAERKGELKYVTDNKRDTVYVYKTVRDTVFLRYPDEDAPLINPSFFKRWPKQIAIKTNALFDLMLIPNLALEVYLGHKWSVNAEVFYAAWQYGNQKSSQWWWHTSGVGGEIKRWFLSPEPLRGLALGAYYDYFTYDFRVRPSQASAQGQLSHGSWSAGLNLSWSTRLSGRLNLEFNLGAGYVTGEYWNYDYCQQHDAWEPVRPSARLRRYIGPTRAGINLVWLLRKRTR